jgi:hypothetical protein
MARISLLIEMDTDPVPGAFHTLEDCAIRLQHMLGQNIPHYNPTVEVLHEATLPTERES